MTLENDIPLWENLHWDRNLKIRSLSEPCAVIVRSGCRLRLVDPRKVEQILGVSREEADPSTSSAASAADNGLSLFKSIPFNKTEAKIATELNQNHETMSFPESEKREKIGRIQFGSTWMGF